MSSQGKTAASIRLTDGTVVQGGLPRGYVLEARVARATVSTVAIGAAGITSRLRDSADTAGPVGMRSFNSQIRCYRIVVEELQR